MDAVFELKQKQLNLVEKKQAKVKKVDQSQIKYVFSDYGGDRQIDCEETKGKLFPSR